MIFPVQATVEEARAFCTDFKAQVVVAGWAPDAVRMLPGRVPIVAPSDAEAADLDGELNDLILPVNGLNLAPGSMNYDLSIHPIHGPVLAIRDQIRGSEGRFDVIISDARARFDARRTRPAIRQGSRLRHGSWLCQVRRAAQNCRRPRLAMGAGAADGFIIMPPFLPAGPEPFTAPFVPELQRRGLFRRDYADPRFAITLDRQSRQSRCRTPAGKVLQASNRTFKGVR